MVYSCGAVLLESTKENIILIFFSCLEFLVWQMLSAQEAERGGGGGGGGGVEGENEGKWG